MHIKNLTLFIFVTTLLVTLAQPGFSATVDYADAINKAGKQRMLSQRIAKAYLFYGQRVRTDKAKRQLNASLEEFVANHQFLKANIPSPGVQDMLKFVEFSIDQYAELVSKPYSAENALKVLDLSETLLEASQDVVVKIETISGTHKSKTVNLSGRQRMLSQRIAKFYIAYQAGFHDENTTLQLQQAVSQFEDAQQLLLNDPLNSPEIDQLLARTERLWGIVTPFFLDVESGGLPVTVFGTTDQIMDYMNTVTGLYVTAESGAAQAK